MIALSEEHLNSLLYVEPLIKLILRIPLVLQLTQLRKAVSVDLFQRLIAMRKVDISNSS